VPYARHLAGRPFRRLTALIVPTLDDRALITLPKSLTLLYYVIRPIRLARKHGARLVRRGPKMPGRARVSPSQSLRSTSKWAS
jgi:hypothetical protein